MAGRKKKEKCDTHYEFTPPPWARPMRVHSGVTWLWIQDGNGALCCLLQYLAADAIHCNYIVPGATGLARVPYSHEKEGNVTYIVNSRGTSSSYAGTYRFKWLCTTSISLFSFKKNWSMWHDAMQIAHSFCPGWKQQIYTVTSLRHVQMSRASQMLMPLKNASNNLISMMCFKADYQQQDNALLLNTTAQIACFHGGLTTCHMYNQRPE